MRIAVMGAGGVGGYFGGLLAMAGEDIWFIARGAHLRAMQRTGLTVKSVAGDFAVPVQAAADPREAESIDLILFCVKTYDTDEALESLKPAVHKGTVFLPLQNGVESAEKIGSRFGANRVLGGVAYIESFVATPGVIEQRSKIRRVELGELNGTETDRARKILEILRKAGIDAHLRADIRKALWEKFAWIAAGGSMMAVTRSPIGDVLASPGTRRLLVAAVQWVDAVARAEGIPVGADLVERTVALGQSLEPMLKSSMLRDLERGNRLEVDALNGAVVRLGGKHGVSTPVNSFIYDLLKLEDEKNRRRPATPDVRDKTP